MNASAFDSPKRADVKAETDPAATAARRGREAGRVGAGWTAGSRRPDMPRWLSRLQEFARAPGGGSAVEPALAIAVLVVVFGGLMAIVHTAYSDDRMGRAARAAARAVALQADSSTAKTELESMACAAIRGELDLEDDFDCAGAWTLTVAADLTPSSLKRGTNGSESPGDMVLVEIEWQRAPWTKVVSALEGSDKRIATGVARLEPAEPEADS